MSDTNTPDTASLAREWLETAKSKWRLQVLQHRSRYNPRTGEYRKLPTRVRRFLNGTPVGLKTAVLELLEAGAPYASPVFDCEEDGLVYRPTNTFIRKDGPEHTTNGRDATYTIIQDLLLDDGTADAYGFTDESGCAQVGETEYHWDEPYIPDCPDGGQGVSYQVTDINRDRETDLLSYRIRKVQSLTVHVPPQVEECDGRKRVTVETWDNVYGEPGDFRQDPVRGGGARIDIPEPCSAPVGTTVRVDVQRNGDCTYRVTVQTTDARTDAEAQYTVYRDQYKANESERTLNAFAPLPKSGVEYAGGVTTRYTSEHNEDGTWTNTVERDTERRVPKSTVETSVTPRGVRRSWTDTNQESPAAGISSQFGTWKYTKTPGGLFTNEYVEYTRSVIENLGMVCTETAFAKTHEKQSGVESIPADEHVPSPSGGLVTTFVYDTDGEGFVTKRVRTEQEHTVEFAVRRRTWGFLGTTSGYVHRSVPRSVADAIYSEGSVGSSVEVKLTNGGMYDVDAQTFLRVSGLRLGLDCSKTVYQHVHEVATSADSIGDEARDAGNGHTYQRTYTVDTTTGAITRRERDTTELHVPESRRAVRVTPRGTTVRTTESNVPGRPGDATKPGTETDWELTPGGRYNVTRTSTEANPGEYGNTCEKDAFLHTDGSVRAKESPPDGHVDGGRGGEYAERSARLGDDGLWEVVDTRHVEERNVDDGVDVVVTARGRRRTTKTRQSASRPAEPGVDEAGKALRTSRTRGGLYNVEETETEARESENAKTREKDVFLESRSDTDMKRELPASFEDLAGAGEGGKYLERSARLGDDGLWEVTKARHDERPSVDDGVDIVVSSRGRRTTTKTRQVTKAYADAKKPGVDEAGKALRTSRTRGGLYNVEETETEARESENAKTREKDVFLESRSDTDMKRELPASFEDLAGAGEGGKYLERSARLGDDGLWEVTKARHDERPSVDDGVDIVVSSRGRRTTTKTRQVTKAYADAKKPGVDEAGKALRTSRTRGGLYNVEETKTEARESENAKTRERDHFLHTDGSSKLRKEIPADFEQGLRDWGRDGKYGEKTARLGDDGLWELTEAEHTEQRDIEEIRVTVTARARRKTKVTRQTDGTGAREPQPRTADVGKEFSKSRTRGGLFNIEETEVSAVAGTTLKECSKDLFMHDHVTGRTEEEPDGDDHVDEVQDMSGKFSSRRQQLGDDGLWGKQETTHNEQSVRKQRVEERTNRHGLVVRTTHVQGTDEGDALTPQDAPGKERVLEKTRGARRNLTTVEVKPRAGRKLDLACEKTAFLHTTDFTDVLAEAPGDDPHVDNAADGVYRTGRWTLQDDGVWERRDTKHEEYQREYKTQQYEDAFGSLTITDETSHGQQAGGQGGKTYTLEKLVRSVEAQMTNGLRYNVRTREETPKEVDSGWLHFEKTTSSGLAVFYDFIVFRNAKKTQVKAWIQYIQAITYTGFKGQFENRPSINANPNKFGLWDGTIALTTLFMPKAHAAGGSTKDDDWETSEIPVTSVNFVPLSGSKLLKIVTTEFHVKGGGVGQEKLEARLANGVIKGSQYSYHPGGQSFSYDLIVRAETKGIVMNMPGANQADQLWNGQAL